MVIKLKEMPDGVRYVVAGNNVAVNAAVTKSELGQIVSEAIETVFNERKRDTA